MACYCGNCPSHQNWNYPPAESASSYKPIKDPYKKEDKVTVKRKTEFTIEGNITFGDLLEFVEEAESAGMPIDARVKISTWAGDQREPGFDTITVSG